MDWGTIAALLISGFGFLYTYIRNKKTDIEGLERRIAALEVDVSTHDTHISQIIKEQETISTNIEKLREQFHAMDMNIMKVLTILEEREKQNKGQ